MFTLNVCENLFDTYFACLRLTYFRSLKILTELLTPLHAGFYYYHESTTLRVCIVCVCFCRLEDASLANCKLQQSLKIKEEKITELETKYALTPSFVTVTYVYQSIASRAGPRRYSSSLFASYRSRFSAMLGEYCPTSSWYEPSKSSSVFPFLPGSEA